MLAKLNEALITVTCATCDKVFQDYRSNKRKFCCRRCYELDKRGTPISEKHRAALRQKIPWNKGIKVNLTAEAREKMRQAHLGKSPANKGIPMSEEQRKKVSEATKGIKKPKLAEIMRSRKGSLANRWEGGKTAEIKRIRNSDDFDRWRKAVYTRDDYTCQDCGQRGGHLNAHHIKEFAKFPELRFEVDNGLTLCHKCHYKIHGMILGSPKRKRKKSERGNDLSESRF